MIVTIVLFTAVIVPFAHSQTTPVFYLNSGVSIPAAPDAFSDYRKMGLNLGGGMGYPLTSNLTLQGYVDYNNFTFDEERFLADRGRLGERGVSIDGGAATILTISGNLKVSVPSSTARIAPFFTGGVSFFKRSISDVSISGTRFKVEFDDIDSATAFSIGFGAGLDVNLSDHVALFIEGKYAIGFTEDESTQYVPVKLGLVFNI